MSAALLSADILISPHRIKMFTWLKCLSHSSQPPASHPALSLSKTNISRKILCSLQSIPALEESRGDTRIPELRERGSIPAGTFFEKIQHWEGEQWAEKGLVRAVECRVGGGRSGIGR